MKTKIPEDESETMVKKVTKFGERGGHIIVPEKYVGKIAYVTLPSEDVRAWELSYGELQEAIVGAEASLKRMRDSKLKFHYQQCIKAIQDPTFNIDDVTKVQALLAKSKVEGYKMLSHRIKEVYKI